jgi:hypothetical protein
VATSASAAPAGRAGVVQVKPGVLFTTIAPAGFRLLQAIERAARAVRVELTITSACDGAHSGPEDPHHRGEAYDVRSHGLPEAVKDAVLAQILAACNDDGTGPAQPVPDIARSLASSKFFGFLEGAGTPNEHLHVQLRKGRSYP